MTRSQRGWLFLGLVFVLALAVVTPVVYMHGGDPTLIHSCVNKSSGEIKIVSANATCKNNETALDWPATSPAPSPTPTPTPTPSPTPSAGGAILDARGNFSLAASTTTFAMNVEEGTESFVQVNVPRGGQLANLFVHPTVSPAGGAILTVTVRVNGADTLLAVTHTSVDGTNTVSNIANTVPVNQGDFVAVKFTESGGVVPGAVYRASFELK
jgi:hypothetical protein